MGYHTGLISRLQSFIPMHFTKYIFSIFLERLEDSKVQNILFRHVFVYFSIDSNAIQGIIEVAMKTNYEYVSLTRYRDTKFRVMES